MTYLPKHDSDWSVPHDTDSKAQPVLWQLAPNNRRVIYVEKAFIREAVVENEWFLLADDAEPKLYPSGKLKVEVECYWYGCKPKETWMHLTLLQDYFIKTSKGERVVINIARHKT